MLQCISLFHKQSNMILDNHGSDGSVNGVPNVSLDHVANATADDAINDAVNVVGNGDVTHVANGFVSHSTNAGINRATTTSMSISARLARVANTQDRGRQFYLFFERYRFILLNGQRDDRRHINRERVLLQQLEAFLSKVEGLHNSVLINRTLALLRALIAIVELRIRAYSRNVADAGRMASLLMDYLADVTHM